MTASAPARPWNLTRLVGARRFSAFQANVFEVAPLHINRRNSAFYHELVSFDVLQSLLLERILTYPAVRLVKNGQFLHRSEYCDDYQIGDAIASGIVDRDRMNKLLAAGATVVVNALDYHLPQLAGLCDAVAEELQCRTHANSYLTPPNAEGFAAHYDTHDVLVLQLAGSKTWSIHRPPFALPLPGSECELPSELGKPALEAELRAGDLLYLPRGWVHAARTSVECSLHVTLGLVPITWFDVAIAAIKAAARDEVGLRQVVRAEGRPPASCEGLLIGIGDFAHALKDLRDKARSSRIHGPSTLSLRNGKLLE